MHASTWQALRAASSHTQPFACRYIAGQRLPCLRRTFTSSRHRLREDDPGNTPSAIWDHIIETPTKTNENTVEQHNLVNGPDDPPEKPPRPKDPSNYGSASRRAGRNVRRIKELPQVIVPPWFLERNAITVEDLVKRQSIIKQDVATPWKGEDERTSNISNSSPLPESEQPSVEAFDTSAEDPADHDLARHLEIDRSVLGEIISLVQAGLRIPEPQSADDVSSIKPHVLLCCPRNGALSYLDVMTQDIARTSKTDFLRLTPQDIAEVGGSYMEEPWSYQSNTLSSLGYDVTQVRVIQPPAPPEDSAEQEEYEEEQEEQSHQEPGRPFPSRQGSHSMSLVPTFVGTFSSIQDIFKQLKSPNSDAAEGSGPSSKPSNGKPVVNMKDSTTDMKLSLLIETLLNVPEQKRLLMRQTQDEPDMTAEPGSAPNDSAVDPHTNGDSLHKVQDVRRGSNGLVVLVEDYPLINMTANGGKFLDKLHDIVDTRRREGQQVLVVGTASSKKILSSGEKSLIDDVQSQPWNGPIRTIVVPVGEKTDGIMRTEQKRKIRDINLRHLRDMFRRIAPVQEQVAAVIYDFDLSIESKWAFLGGLERSVWSLDRVNRLANIALGQLRGPEPMRPQTIEDAIGIMDASDQSKYAWLKKEKERKSKETDSSQSPLDDASRDDSAPKMRKLRKKCNSYEKKLLNGVVDAKNIRTTFADVQAPRETIEALKTLTSLSLVRPDAFTYGVLATDRIPGLLLYGPPGTGKTLLAKAVAKESGATMLEVSGSDVYDMYVGEGEKNVKAIFTLAKKLSPCIVFIDEADAILGTRSSGHSRTSHRELINQFLREWDGMTDMSAFIMVATNRPFDLDEASLRRLPRRLLVDLPVEKDREAILKIHLKDEVLDPAVSIAQLATKTPFYSGSDLKNLCVAAALACVREEFDAAMAHNKEAPEEKFQYAEKRTLEPRHFNKAMEEISASISEDMGSLSAIRKFDEKYGDRRGRRKKLGGYGFKTVDDAEKLGSDAARVRNQT